MDVELKCRHNPVLFKLDSIEFKNLYSPEVEDLKKLFDKYNYEIRIAGGAVRYASVKALLQMHTQSLQKHII